MTNSKTWFVDIDGTLIKHGGNLSNMILNPPELIDGTLQKLQEWNLNGDTIILTTGRPESCREVTEKQLRNLGIFYDRLLMSIGVGLRVVVNDEKPGGLITAKAVCLKRDEGIGSIEL